MAKRETELPYVKLLQRVLAGYANDPKAHFRLSRFLPEIAGKLYSVGEEIDEARLLELAALDDEAQKQALQKASSRAKAVKGKLTYERVLAEIGGDTSFLDLEGPGRIMRLEAALEKGDKHDFGDLIAAVKADRVDLLKRACEVHPAYIDLGSEDVPPEQFGGMGIMAMMAIDASAVECLKFLNDKSHGAVFKIGDLLSLAVRSGNNDVVDIYLRSIKPRYKEEALEKMNAPHLAVWRDAVRSLAEELKSGEEILNNKIFAAETAHATPLLNSLYVTGQITRTARDAAARLITNPGEDESLGQIFRQAAVHAMHLRRAHSEFLYKNICVAAAFENYGVMRNLLDSAPALRDRETFLEGIEGAERVPRTPWDAHIESSIEVGIQMGMLASAEMGRMIALETLHAERPDLVHDMIEFGDFQCAYDAGQEEVIAFIEHVAEEQGVKNEYGEKRRQLQEKQQSWKKTARQEAPAHLPEADPRHFRPQTFDAVRGWLKREDTENLEVNKQAWAMSVLFRREQEVLRYMRKWGGKHAGMNRGVLTSLAADIKLPADLNEFDIKAWADAAHRFGPNMIQLLPEARHCPKPLANYQKTLEAIAPKSYVGGEEHPELAILARGGNAKQADFDAARALVEAYAAEPKPESHLPNFKIDGDDFGMKGASFEKLPDGDVRGLFLGEFTDCCQSIHREARKAARHGFTSPQGGFYIVKSSKDEIIGQIWAWRGQSGELVFDSLETLGKRIKPHQWQRLMENIADRIASDKERDITGLRIGTSGKTPKLPFAETENPARPKDHDYVSDSKKQYAVPLIRLRDLPRPDADAEPEAKKKAKDTPSPSI